MIFTIGNELLHLYPGEFILDGKVLLQCRNVMIRRSNDLLRAEYFHASFLQALKGLRAGDFVNEMFVDIQH